jgi:uncharacterized glyoxalase superfamily protein PhnB
MSTNTSNGSATSGVDGLQGTALSVSFTVKDLTASIGWYRDVLGFTVSQEYERDGAVRAASMTAGSVRILLNQDDGAKGWTRVKGEGFAVQVTTEQSIDAIADRAKANGANLDLEPTDTPWGARLFRITDPDGFKLSISSPRRA